MVQYENRWINCNAFTQWDIMQPWKESRKGKKEEGREEGSEEGR